MIANLDWFLITDTNQMILDAYYKGIINGLSKFSANGFYYFFDPSTLEKPFNLQRIEGRIVRRGYLLPTDDLSMLIPL